MKVIEIYKIHTPCVIQYLHKLNIFDNCSIINKTYYAPQEATL
jgi:hypothetical protein